MIESKASLLIASHSLADAELVKALLEEDFEAIDVLIVDAVRSEQHRASAAGGPGKSPHVFVLAFRELAASEHCYLGLLRQAAMQPMRRHRAIVLCRREDVQDAYRLCRRGLFDDYVLFWPPSADGPRLLMAVHGALRSLVDLREPPSRAAAPEAFDGGFSPAGAPEASNVRAGAPQSAGAPEAAAAVEPGAPGGSEQSVLIVDDDAGVRTMMSRFLAAAGFVVRVAASGREALRLVGEAAPDLVLLDYRMPDVDGLEVLRALRAQVALKSLPVMVVTGAADRDLVRRTLEFGVTDLLVKPFDRNTLLSKVRRALGGTERRGGTEAKP